MAIAIVLFAAAAIGGLVLAVRRARNESLPPPLAVIHGVAAATGLAVLLYVVLASSAPSTAGIALVLLIAAALGGFVAVSFHLRKRPIPMPLIVIHALVAVSGFLLLVVAAVGA